MKLYSYYRSSSSYRVRIALNIKGVKYDIEPVHLVRNGGEQHSDSYKKLNPQELVPTLVDGDHTITQAQAIMEYLEETIPEPALLPKDPYARAFARQISMICIADIHPINNLRVLNYITNDLGASQSQKMEWYHHWIKLGFDALEKEIVNNPFHKKDSGFCIGNGVTMADVSLIPQVYNAARYEMDLSAWPTIASINEKCLSLKAFDDASPEKQPDTPEDHRPVFLKGKG